MQGYINVRNTLYTVHCTLYTVHCTLYTVHCTMYTVHCTVVSKVSSYTFTPCICLLSFYLSFLSTYPSIYLYLYFIYLSIYLSIYISIYIYLSIHMHLSSSIYIYFACLFVCLCPINVKTAEPIGAKFCVSPHNTPKKWSNFQNFVHKSFYFVKIWKCAKNTMKSASFFIFILYKEKMLTDKGTIKSWNRRWARIALSLLYIFLSIHLYYISIYISIYYLSIYLSLFLYLSTLSASESTGLFTSTENVKTVSIQCYSGDRFHHDKPTHFSILLQFVQV